MHASRIGTQGAYLGMGTEKKRPMGVLRGVARRDGCVRVISGWGRGRGAEGSGGQRGRSRGRGRIEREVRGVLVRQRSSGMLRGVRFRPQPGHGRGEARLVRRMSKAMPAR